MPEDEKKDDKKDKGRKGEPTFIEDVINQLIDSYLGPGLKALVRRIPKQNEAKIKSIARFIRYSADGISIVVARVTKTSPMLDNFRTRFIGALRNIAKEIDEGTFQWEEKVPAEGAPGERAREEKRQAVDALRLLILMVPSGERAKLLEAVKELGEMHRELVQEAFNSLSPDALKQFAQGIGKKWVSKRGVAQPEAWKDIFALFMELNQAPTKPKEPEDVENKALTKIFSLQDKDVRELITKFIGLLKSPGERKKVLTIMADWELDAFTLFTQLTDQEREAVLGLFRQEPVSHEDFVNRVEQLIDKYGDKIKRFFQVLKNPFAKAKEKSKERAKAYRDFGDKMLEGTPFEFLQTDKWWPKGEEEPVKEEVS